MKRTGLPGTLQKLGEVALGDELWGVYDRGTEDGHDRLKLCAITEVEGKANYSISLKDGKVGTDSDGGKLKRERPELAAAVAAYRSAGEVISTPDTSEDPYGDVTKDQNLTVNQLWNRFLLSQRIFFVQGTRFLGYKKTTHEPAEVQRRFESWATLCTLMNIRPSEKAQTAMRERIAAPYDHPHYADPEAGVRPDPYKFAEHIRAERGRFVGDIPNVDEGIAWVTDPIVPKAVGRLLKAYHSGKYKPHSRRTIAGLLNPGSAFAAEPEKTVDDPFGLW
jgi:hypothetical protein